jgi:hypothetical protein
MIFVGKCDNVTMTVIFNLMEVVMKEAVIHARFLCLGLSLCSLSQMEKGRMRVEALPGALAEHRFPICGCGTVHRELNLGDAQVQEMLHQCFRST